MKRRRSCPPIKIGSASFAGFRFPPEVILLAVRWYLRYGLSYRDLEELLAERGLDVDHVTLYRWVQRFTPLILEAARPCRHAIGDRWFVDETSSWGLFAGHGGRALGAHPPAVADGLELLLVVARPLQPRRVSAHGHDDTCGGGSGRPGGQEVDVRQVALLH